MNTWAKAVRGKYRRSESSAAGPAMKNSIYVLMVPVSFWDIRVSKQTLFRKPPSKAGRALQWEDSVTSRWKGGLRKA